jgi:RHS repeat-associated protein
VTKITDTDGNTYESYDYYQVTGSGGGFGQGMLEDILQPGSTAGTYQATFTYHYDQMNRVIQRDFTDITGTTTSIYPAYNDSMGRLTSFRNAFGTFQYNYVDETTNVKSITYPNNQVANFAYYPDVPAGGTHNGDESLRQIQNVKPDGTTTLSQFDYTYDQAGRVATWTKQFSSGPTSTSTYGFAYDNDDQLISATPTAGATIAYGYGYDAAGNRTAAQVDAALTGFSVDSTNQFSSVNSNGATRFEGDLTQYATVTINGNTANIDTNNHFVGYANVASGNNTVSITATNPNDPNQSVTKSYSVQGGSGTSQPYGYSGGDLNSDGANTYVWNALNQLVQINYAATQNVTKFSYDGAGRRVGITELTYNTATNSYTVAHNQTFIWEGMSIVQESDSVTNEIRQYPGGGEIINGTPYYAAGDHLGSTRELTDQSGSPHAEYEYDPYGAAQKLSGDVDARFQYAGYHYHKASGLSLTPSRAYNPALGAWLSRDPLGEAGGLNMFGYVGGNPINYSDPSGLSPGAAFVGGLLNGGIIAAGIVIVAAPEIATIGALAEAGDLFYGAVALFGEVAFDASIETTGYDVFTGTDFWSGRCLSDDERASEAGWLLGGEIGGGIADGLFGEGMMGRMSKPSGNCFPPGTLVLMADGSKKSIETIQEGDEVLAQEPGLENGPTARRVTGVQKNWTRRLFHVEVRDESGDAVSGEFASTGEHPIWTKNRGWVHAKDLIAGDLLAQADGGSGTVSQITEEHASYNTYNLSVEAVHTFFVFAGSISVLVHNVQLHHPWPKYLGGPELQDLIPLSDEVHIAYHKLLKDMGIPKELGSIYYENVWILSPAQKLEDLRTFRDATKAFDETYGTNLLDAAIAEGMWIPCE